MGREQSFAIHAQELANKESNRDGGADGGSGTILIDRTGSRVTRPFYTLTHASPSFMQRP